MNRHFFICLLLASFWSSLTGYSSAAPKPEQAAGPAVILPPIWQAASPVQRLTAIRIAELDASRLLAERVYGVQLEGDSTVRDLAELDDSVGATVSQLIRGVATTAGPTYYDDGRLEVVRAVKVSKLIEVIKQVYEKSTSRELKVSRNTSQKLETEVIDALGNAALPGSDGHKKILAKRAAELDAYRRLTERCLGVQISSDSTLRNFVISSDKIKSSLIGALKSAETTRIVYQSDNTCAITMKLAIGPLVRVVKKAIEKSGQTTITSSTVSQDTIEETGQGAPRTAETAVSASSAVGGGAITEIEIQKIIDQEMK